MAACTTSSQPSTAVLQAVPDGAQALTLLSITSVSARSSCMGILLCGTNQITLHSQPSNTTPKSLPDPHLVSQAEDAGCVADVGLVQPLRVVVGQHLVKGLSKWKTAEGAGK